MTRFTASKPCPVCGGFDPMPRGEGKRCYGFMSDDGEWVHCTREEYAGSAPFNEKSNAYVHKLKGDCRCGQAHDPNPHPVKHTGPWPRPVKTYDYPDERGKLLFQAVRYGNPKSFKQRRPDGNAGWIWNLNGTPRVLYRLPELIARAGETVFLVEGEKDVDRLMDAGLLATTNPMGAGKWRSEYNGTLEGHPVCIVPDLNDSLDKSPDHRDHRKGEKHAEQVAGELYGTAKSVRVLRLPGMDGVEGADVSDWLDRGHTVDELERLAREAPEWEPSAADVVVSVDGPEKWEPPTQFHEFDLPSFPTDTFPPWLREFVEAEAEATQTPVDLSAMLALATVSGALAGKVQVEAVAGWREPVNLWTCVGMPPGSRKSVVFRHVLEPIQEYERSELTRLGPEVAESQTRVRILEAELGKAEREAADASVDNKSPLQQLAEEKARELAAFTRLYPPQYVGDDVTPERLASLLAEQRGRFMVASPEGDIFDLMNGRYSKQANFGVFLRGHAGDDLRVNRVGRAAEFVPNPALTMALAVQPEVLSGFMQNRGFKHRGLLGRFLYALPPSNMGTRSSTPRPMPADVQAAYRYHVMELMALDFAVGQDGQQAPHILRLSPDAANQFTLVRDDIEAMLLPGGELEFMSDWGGKLAGAILRIVSILSIGLLPDRAEWWKTTITSEALSNAHTIGRYLIPHAKAAYALMGSDPDVEDAKYIVGWLERNGTPQVSRRDIHQGCRGRFQKVAAIDAPLGLLVEHGYLRIQEMPHSDQPGRKKSPVYDVNPQTLTQNAHITQNDEDSSNL